MVTVPPGPGLAGGSGSPEPHAGYARHRHSGVAAALYGPSSSALSSQPCWVRPRTGLHPQCLTRHAALDFGLTPPARRSKQPRVNTCARWAAGPVGHRPHRSAVRARGRPGRRGHQGTASRAAAADAAIAGRRPCHRCAGRGQGTGARSPGAGRGGNAL